MSVSIDIREESGIRTLHFGSEWTQGAMRIARPWNLELDYTKEMMASLLLRDESRFPRKVLLIGLGAASLNQVSLSQPTSGQPHCGRNRTRGSCCRPPILQAARRPQAIENSDW